MTTMSADFEALAGAVSGRVSTRPADLEQHGHDENYPQSRPPLAVVFAESTADVQAAVRWAATAGVAVVPFGTGTSFEGRVVPVGDAISIDMTAMNRVLEVRDEDLLAVVQPGVTRMALNEKLRDFGLFFPVDPGADASLGGMAATNASGTTTVRYGGMRVNTVALEVVLANGDAVRFGRPVRKTSSGYAMKDLIVGSGGTLGVVTELTVSLYPVPDHVSAARFVFESVADAARAAYALVVTGLPVARVELMDALSLRAANAYTGAGLIEAPTLLVELHSATAESLVAELAAAEETAREAGAVDVTLASAAEERSALWSLRHNLFFAARALWPGRTYAVGDIAVPLSRMPAMVTFCSDLIGELGLDGMVAGHAGDGNVHSLIAFEPGDPQARYFSDRCVERALSLGGTCSGEHGVGLAKRRWLDAEHGPALDWMRVVKQALDPTGLLNPGKDL
jgi:D-lactate dehydrogenase (cytochrome)